MEAAMMLAPDPLALLRALVAGWLARARLMIWKSEGDGGEGGGDDGASGDGAGGSAAGGGNGDEGGDDDLSDHESLVSDVGEKAAREILKARRDARKADEARRAAEAKIKEHEDAKLSETERAKKEADDARRERDEAVSRANTRIIRSEIKAEAVAQGAIDPDAVVALIDAASVTLDDDGNVKGAKKAVETLLKDKAYLKGNGGAPPRSGGDMREGAGEASGVSMNDRIRAAAGYGSGS